MRRFDVCMHLYYPLGDPISRAISRFFMHVSLNEWIFSNLPLSVALRMGNGSFVGGGCLKCHHNASTYEKASRDNATFYTPLPAFHEGNSSNKCSNKTQNEAVRICIQGLFFSRVSLCFPPQRTIAWLVSLCSRSGS